MRTNETVLVADEVWIATALLHREHPERGDFTIQEIVRRAEQENLHGRLRPGVQVHASLHCVANKAPNKGAYRMLYATGKHTRRLYQSRDDVHFERKGKIAPSRDQIPPRYHELLDWYETQYGMNPPKTPRYEKLLALRGSGKGLWPDPDAYVRSLREGWE